MGTIPEFTFWALGIDLIIIALGLAMLMLVIWQAPGQRDNQLMALFMLTMVLWGSGNFLTHSLDRLGADPRPFFYLNAFSIALNGFALLCLVIVYAGLWKKYRWAQFVVFIGMVFLALLAPLTFQGKIVDLLPGQPAVSSAGYLQYEFQPLGYAAFLITYGRIHPTFPQRAVRLPLNPAAHPAGGGSAIQR